MIERTIRILVVDDDPGLLAVLECGLSQHRDYRLKAVGDAREARREIETGSWDLLVTDYALNDPEFDGIDLLRTARNQARPPLVIMITAFASLQVTLDSIKMGAHNFLTKPFQMDELYLVVRNAETLIRMERENLSLRNRVNELAQSVENVARDQNQLLERLGRLEYEGGSGDGDQGGGVGSMNTAPAVELRRRRMRDQVAVYARAGDSIGAQIQDQRELLSTIAEPSTENRGMTQ
jgi:CheY-like chemotaxis protein